MRTTVVRRLMMTVDGWKREIEKLIIPENEIE